MLKANTANRVVNRIVGLAFAFSAIGICTSAPIHAQAKPKPGAQPAVAAIASPTGTIRGKVIDSANGEPMIGVTAVIKELGIYGVTDIDGFYTISNVPVGAQTVTYQITGYQPSSTQVQVNTGRPAIVNVTLNYKVTSEVVVTAKRVDNTAAALLSKRKKAAAAQDAISAEQISKSPDSDAGDAAKRVTGITVIDGKYVYVRGLGERYSSVQFNGSTIPSPNPDKRVIPLDIFPAALLDNLIVSKTYTVDMPAEFAGGLVQINPKDYPEEKELKISVSTGFNTVTTGQTFLGSQGGGALDLLGIDDGTRGLPSRVDALTQSGRKLTVADVNNPNGFSAGDIERAGESFPRTWGIDKKTGLPPGGVQFSFGNTYKLSERTTMGIITAGLVRQSSETIRDKTYKTYFAPGVIRNDYKMDTSTYNTTKGGLLGLTFGVGKYDKIRVNSFYTQNSEDTVQETKGTDAENRQVRDVRSKYIEYGLLFSQLSGEHVMPSFLDAKFTWKSSYSRATFNQPDYKAWTQQTTGATALLLFQGDSPSRVFTDHVDQTVDLQPELAIPFTQWGGLKSTFSVGGYANYRIRDSKTRRFQFINSGSSTNIAGEPNDLLTPANISATGFAIRELTGANDAYTGEQQILAGYGQLDMPLIPDLRLVAGGRYEQSKITVTSFDIYGTNAPTKGILQNQNAIPSANLIYSITSDINLRTAASMTVTRPDFREMTPFLFLAVVGGDTIKGEPTLQQGTIQNYDMRLEWFPGVGEVIALSGFYKKFINPVEVNELVGADLVITYANIPGAYNAGGELEISKNLGFIAKALDEFSIFSNYSLIKSQVSLPANSNLTNKDRALQGQSPYVINAGISYDRLPLGLSMTVLYNLAGRRIVRVGSTGREDTYEEPVHRLDAVVKKTFGASSALKLTAANLLNAEYRATQGSNVSYSYYRGITFGLSYDVRF